MTDQREDKEKNVSDDGIDYRAEGSDPGNHKETPTDRGYDEAAHSGNARNLREGSGGVFGTTGGGTSGGGFQVVDPEEDIADPRRQPQESDPERSTISRSDAEGVAQIRDKK